jgi:hypothetical protein
MREVRGKVPGASVFAAGYLGPTLSIVCLFNDPVVWSGVIAGLFFLLLLMSKKYFIFALSENKKYACLILASLAFITLGSVVIDVAFMVFGVFLGPFFYFYAIRLYEKGEE